MFNPPGCNVSSEENSMLFPAELVVNCHPINRVHQRERRLLQTLKNCLSLHKSQIMRFIGKYRVWNFFS